MCPRPLRNQNRKRRADNPLHDQVPTTNTHPSDVFPEPSRLQNCKKRPNDSLQDQIPWKKSKSSGAVHRPWNFPPEFYDNLSKVWLTPRALQELNRRNESLSLPTRTVDQQCIEDLPLAARKGGPDLRDLQGTASSKSRRSSAYDANFEQHLIDHDIYPRFMIFRMTVDPPSQPTGKRSDKLSRFLGGRFHRP